MNQDELALIAECVAGQEAAATRLVHSHQGMVYRIAWRYTSNRADAEDMVQDVFLRVFRALPGFRSDCPLQAWIAGIAINRARGLGAKKSRVRRVLDLLLLRRDVGSREVPLSGSVPPRPDQSLYLRERSHAIRTGLTKLTEDQRGVLLLFIEGLSAKDIAIALDLPDATVRSHLFRARLQLAKDLPDDFASSEIIEESASLPLREAGGER